MLEGVLDERRDHLREPSRRREHHRRPVDVDDELAVERLEGRAPLLDLLAHDVGAYRSIDGIALDGLTFHTITDKVRLDMELARVRDEGWAAEVEECEPEIAALAAPIRDQHGSVVAAVGVGGHRDRLCDTRGRPHQALITLVVQTGRSISRELGHGRGR